MSQLRTAGAGACTLGLMLAALPACGAAPSWFVRSFGEATATAATSPFAAPVLDDHTFGNDSALLQQPSFSGNTGAAARATFDNITDGTAAQAADASAMSFVSLGALHAVAGADSTVSNVLTTVTGASSFMQESWGDQLTFHTGTLGADYTFSVTLNDNLSNSLSPAADGFYVTNTDSSAQAYTILYITGLANPLEIADSLTEVAPPVSVQMGGIPTLFQNPPPSRTLSTTIHVFDGTTLSVDQILHVQAGVGGNGTAGANAGDTAFFDLFTSDPGASYTSASDTIYATSGEPRVSPVPEPSELVLMLAGLGALGVLGRRWFTVRN